MRTNNEVVKIGHSGLTAGGMAHVYHYPTTGSYLVLLTNTVDNSKSGTMEWSGNLMVGSGMESIMDEFESIIIP